MVNGSDNRGGTGAPATIRRASWFLVLLMLVACALAAQAHAGTVKSLPTIATTITSGPGEGATISDPSPTFEFNATSDGSPLPTATFKCSIDGGPEASCASPDQIGPLSDGPHTFKVTATDPNSGAFDLLPPTRSFTVATSPTPPDNGPYPPAACILRTARARIFTYTSKNKVRLVIRYTSLAPAKVTVEYRLKGRKGTLKIGKATRRFARKGLFRLPVKLSKARMAKVLAAKAFTVRMHIPAAPSYCNRYYTRHLTIKRKVSGQAVWFQSGSIFGT